jgi:hypothetical protein
MSFKMETFEQISNTSKKRRLTPEMLQKMKEGKQRKAAERQEAKRIDETNHNIRCALFLLGIVVAIGSSLWAGSAGWYLCIAGIICMYIPYRNGQKVDKMETYHRWDLTDDIELLFLGVFGMALPFLIFHGVGGICFGILTLAMFVTLIEAIPVIAGIALLFWFIGL